MADIPLLKSPVALTELAGADVAPDGAAPTADGAGGVAWEVPAGGSSGGMTLLDTQVLGAAAAQIDFTSIPGTYSDLLIVGRLRSSGTGGATLGVRAGGAALDTGANYRWAQTIDGTTEANTRSGGDTEWEVTSAALPDAGGDASTWADVEIRIFDYADTSFRRLMRASVFSHYSSALYLVYDSHAEWLNTADAIQRLRFMNMASTWVAGSKLRLYGLG